MSLFFNDSEKSSMFSMMNNRVFANFFYGIFNKVDQFTSSPGLSNSDTSTDFWHHAMEYLGDAAFVASIKPNPKLNNWVRSSTLELARMPIADWVGPVFRNHENEDMGHLETAHISMAISFALDFAPDVFCELEIQELKNTLRERALPLCKKWLDSNFHLSNWRAILLAGYASASAILDDKEALDYAYNEYNFCLNAIQDDGSLGESLQYSNYLNFGMMISYESLTRRGYSLDMSKYGKAVNWYCHSLLYKKPLANWGEYPRPRSLNFNDSAAIFGASPDILTHISRELKEKLPQEAGLASWLFFHLYSENVNQEPFDRSSFGFLNRFGFMTLINFSHISSPLPPTELATTVRYDNGDAISRSDWSDAPTVLAMKTSSANLNDVAHSHLDLNSIQLSYGKERMLADTGHSCYRNLIHNLEIGTANHNTCTFTMDKGESGVATLTQDAPTIRRFTHDKILSEPVKRSGKFLLAAQIDEVSVLANDAGEAYGDEIREFSRFAIRCGKNVVFVIDRIDTSAPVKSHWHWLFNNRDEILEYKNPLKDRLVIRRGNVGMKIFNLSPNISVNGFLYSYIHDAYHPLPNQKGEGFSGSGRLFSWSEKEFISGLRINIHGFAVDEYGPIALWHLRKESEQICSMEGGNSVCNWQVDTTNPKEIIISETQSHRQYKIALTNNNLWSLTR